MAAPGEVQEGITAQLMRVDDTRYLRLNFDLNGEKAVDSNKFVNKYINQEVGEGMDDPTQYPVYREVVAKYLDSQYNQDWKDKLTIKDKIKEFIDANS
jgi:hypothetical protein